MTSAAATELPDALAESEHYDLCLYVAGQSPRSLTALVNLKRLCEDHLPGRYEIDVVDLMESPQLAAQDEIIAIPTLVRRRPMPIRKVIGDLSNTERVLAGLQLEAKDG